MASAFMALILFLFLAIVPNQQLFSQCNTAPMVGPLDLTINMSGPTAVINTATVSSVLIAVDGGMPCINCELYYSLVPGGPYIRLSNNPYDVICTGGSFPFSMYFIARRPSMGNPCPSAEIELIIDVNDVQPPTIICPPAQIVDADINCVASLPGLIFTDVSSGNAAVPLEYGDNCGTPTISYTADMGAAPASGMSGTSPFDLSGMVFQLGTTTITMTVDDGTNTTNCDFTVTVADNDEPTWRPEPTSIAQWLVDTLGISPASTAITSILYAGPGFNRLTVTLNCDDPDYTTVYNYFANTYVPTAVDNCDSNPTEIFNNQLDVLPWICPTVEHIQRRWRAEDAAGNAIPPPGPTAPLAKLDLITQNNIAPIFTTAPMDVTIGANDPMVCGIDLTGTTFIEVEASSDCQGAPTYGWNITSAPLTFGGALNGVSNNAEQFYVPGLYSITYTATDACSNATNHSFTFEVIDLVPPTVTCPPSQSLSAVLDNCFQNAIWDEAIYMDNCPGTISLDVNGIDPAGNNINILTFLTGGGCTDQPGFDGNFLPVNWNVTGPGTVDWSGAPMSLSITNTNVAGTTTVGIPLLDDGVILFGWDYTTALLSADNEFGYAINGTQYPLVVNGQLVLGSVSGSALTAINIGDVFSFYLIEDGILDNDHAVEITNFIFLCGSGSNISFASFPVGVSTITYTVTDAAMNTTTCNFNVTVTDDQDPIITCGGDQTIFTVCPTTPIPDYTANWASIEENCTGYTITQSPPAGATLGSVFAPNPPMDGDMFMVTLTITDKGGNTDDCTFQVNLVDNDLPVPDVTPLPAINPMTTLGTDCNTYIICAPTATKCNGEVVYGTTSLGGAVFDPNLCGPGLPGYTITGPSFNAILWTYDDGLGNIITQNQQVDIFADVTAPTLDCPADITVDTDPGVCTTTGISGLDINEILPTIAPYLNAADQPNDGEMIDNCGITAIGWSATSGSAANTNDAGTGTYDLGVNTVTYTASDAAGNTASCQFSIIVVDNQPPVVGCLGPVVTLFTGDGVDQNMDDCGYTMPLLGTFLDPTIIFENCPGNITVSYNVTPITGSFTAGPTTSSLGGSTFSALSSGSGSFLVSWTITDANSNTSLPPCTYTINVQDDQNPVITCPASPIVRTTSQDMNPGDCFYEASGTEFDYLTASDNCSIQFVTNDFNLSNSLDGEFFPKGSTLVTWTAFDGLSNFGTCQVEVIVNDDESPINTYCPSNIVLPNIMGDCNNFAGWTRPNENDWTDNCDMSSDLIITEVISDPGVQAAINLLSPYNQTVISFPITVFPVGTTTITYTATDLSNNSSTCEFTVTIEDIDVPTISCPADQILGTTCLVGTVPDYRGLAFNITDNCQSALTVTQVPAPGTPLGSVPGLVPANGATFNVTLTVTDGNPNNLSASCGFVVTLDETNLPVPDIAVLPSLLDSCSVIEVLAPTADDCGTEIYGVPSQGVLIQANPPIYRYTTGLYNVIWTYIGASGNTIQGQAIEVQDDTTPPNTLCSPVNVNLSSANPGSVTISALDFDNGSTDHCGIIAWDFSVNGGPFLNVQSFGCAEVGMHNVILRASDAAGNEGFCATTLTINDVTNPTIIGGCPLSFSVNTSNNGGYDCEGLATITVPNVTDNCAIVIYDLILDLPGGGSNLTLDALGNPVLAQILPKGITQATFYVEDEHGNSNSCNFNITVIDDEVPQITCPSNASRFNDPGLCSYQTIGKEFDPLNFVDNCPGAFILNDYNGAATLDSEVFAVGSHSIVWTVVDAVGLFTTCSFTIEVLDNEPPVINWCQPNITQVATAGTCNALVSWSPTYVLDVDDNCGIFNLTETISDPSVIPVYPYLPFGPYPPFLLNQALFPVGVTLISYEVEDIHGNTSLCEFTVEIIDDQAPSITCPPDQILNTVCASGVVPDYTGLISNLVDNCVGNLVITQTPAAGTLLSNVPGLNPVDGASFTVTIRAQDPNPLNLFDECTFTVTLDDINLPIPDQAMLPALTSDCESIIVSPPTANDCGTTIVGIPDKGVQISFMPPLYEFEIGLYTVIWSYVGTNGSVQQVQQIQVGPDLTPPTVTCVNTTVTLDANGNGSITAGQVTGSVSDNCGIDNVAVNPNTFNCDNVGSNIVTLTATDNFGNTATCTATVVVQDLTAPTFNINNVTLTANCQSIPPVPNVVPSDACGIASFGLTETSTKGANPANCSFYNYTITRVWNATDVNNNSASVQQVINVQDVTPPVWTNAIPDTIFAETNPFNCTGGIVLIVEPAMVFDNCASFNNLTITYVATNNTSGTTNASGQYPIGTTTLTFNAIDPCGNAAAKVVRIIVEDKTPPTPVCINSITLPLNPQGDLVIPPQVVDNGSYDNCFTPFSSSDVTLDVFPDTFGCDDAGKTFTVVLTVTDAAGNTSTCPALVNIIDNNSPVFVSCAPDVTINCTDDISPASLGEPEFDDACGVFLTFVDNIVQVGGPICYRIDRLWSADDGYGNITNCLQEISVFDNDAPEFTSNLPPSVTIECGPVPTAASIQATDNCSAASVTLSEVSTQTSDLICTDYSYVITRTWTALDACANTTVYVQTLTITDNTAPVISGLPDTLILFTNDFNADSCTVPVELVAQIDDCQPDSVITVQNTGPFGPGTNVASGKYPAGIYEIEFFATDRCGNSSSTQVYLEVVDNSTPVAVCFTNINVSLNSQGFAVVTTGQVDDQSYDNCTIDLELELSKDTFDCTNLGLNIVTLTVTDEAGNSNACTSFVNVEAGPGNEISDVTTVVFETFAGAMDGSVNVVISGGSGQFNYLWAPGGQTTASINNLSSGTYTLIVTDEITGCIRTIVVFVGVAGVPIDTISGIIVTPTGIPVAQAIVEMTGTQTGSYTTDIDGYYEFTVPSGSNVTIRPSKDINPANGVTSLDFAIIQQHILAPPGLKPLTTSFKLIAADENGNNQINGIDIAIFQNTILNNLPTFPNVDSWVFVRSGFVFPVPLEPWSTGWDDEVTFLNISGNKFNTNFVGVKMGDVTDDVDATQIMGGETAETRSNSKLILSVQDRVLTQGEVVEFEIFGTEFEALQAYQFVWDFNSDVLKYVGYTDGQLTNLSPGNFGTTMLSSGQLPHMWHSAVPVSMNQEQALYRLAFEVNKGGILLSEVLSLSSGHLGIIAYDQFGKDMTVELRFTPVQDEENPVVERDFFHFGATPNPFSYQATVKFRLAEEIPVSLTIMDLQGRPMDVIRMDGEPGVNQFVLDHTLFPTPGMYIYVLHAGENRALGKLIYQSN